MRLILSFFIITLLSFSISLNAQEEVSPLQMKRMKLDDFIDGGFASFFNTSEKSKILNEDGTTTIHYKTGGFKEYVDIFIRVNANNIIIASKLEIDRSWIKKSRTFAFDIEKSFINEFSLDKEYTKPLVNKIWTFGKETEEDLKDEQLQGLFDVIIGKEHDHEYTHEGQQLFKFYNLKKEEGGFTLVTEIN